MLAGSWLSGWFIITTNAFMQHPVGHVVRENGVIALDKLSTFLTNEWAFVEYFHTMTGSVVTGSFVVAAVGAFYMLQKKHEDHAKLFLRVGLTVGVVASILMAAPTGDLQARLVVKYQPVAFAAMEGHFFTEDGAALTLIGQPDVDNLKLDNPIEIPKALSFMTHQRWNARIGKELKRLRPVGVARQRPAPLLFVPCDGRARDHLRRHHGPRRGATP